MSELSFLLDLLLNHKLPKVTKDAVAARVREVEIALQSSGPGRQAFTPPAASAGFIPPHLIGQSPSTIAKLMRHPDLAEKLAHPSALSAGSIETIGPEAAAPPTPVAVIAQTPAAQAAMQDRQAAINGQLSGKPEKGRTSPRKF